MKRVLRSILTSLCLLGSRVTLSAEHNFVVPPGEELWINYPAETTHSASSPSTPSPNYKLAACKALREHRKRNATTKSWRLKYDELHAQCAMETIEESIKRLRKQLEKDRERWEKAKQEQEKERQRS